MHKNYPTSALVLFSISLVPYILYFTTDFELSKGLIIITCLAGIISWVLTFIGMKKHPLQNKQFWLLSLFTLPVLSIPVYWIRRERQQHTKA